MKQFNVVTVTLLTLAVLSAPHAFAEKIYGTLWREKYVPSEPSTEAEESWAAAAKKARCYLCHLKGKGKKYCNTYGDVLSEWLKSDDYKSDRIKAEAEKVRTEILQALGRAEVIGDTCGTTFGELFRAYKLPNADMGPQSAEKEKAEEDENADENEDENENEDDEDD